MRDVICEHAQSALVSPGSNARVNGLGCEWRQGGGDRKLVFQEVCL